jgi:hypothetical protein
MTTHQAPLIKAKRKAIASVNKQILAGCMGHLASAPDKRGAEGAEFKADVGVVVTHGMFAIASRASGNSFSKFAAESAGPVSMDPCRAKIPQCDSHPLRHMYGKKPCAPEE